LLAATQRQPLTGRERDIVLSPVKLWVLAMLAPKRGAARGSGPAASGEFDRAYARLPMKWQVGTKEQVL
jgi:hypothetical protein